MYSVTQKINQVKQPYGGYISPKLFDVIQLDDGKILHKTEEGVSPSLVGIVVDYLVRFHATKDIYEAFKISFKGAQIVNEIKQAQEFAKNIKNLDYNSIKNACNLAYYDYAFRQGPSNFIHEKNITPSIDAADNIKILVLRGINFLEIYGPVLAEGFTFENGGYTHTISSGDGDFITEGVIWDFKTVKKITSKHSLQILIYYLMGKHSSQKIFNSIHSVGFFNSRTNQVITLKISKIDPAILKEVEGIIGYS